MKIDTLFIKEKMLSKCVQALSEHFKTLDVNEIRQVLNPLFPSENEEKNNNIGCCKVLVLSGARKGQPCGLKEFVKNSNKCKRHSSKDELIEEKEHKTEEKKEEKKEKKPTTSKNKSKNKIETFNKTEVAALIEERKSTTTLYQNSFGNWEHHATGFVWDQVSKSIIGKQLGNGMIAPLSEHDINLCKLNQWDMKTSEIINTERTLAVASDEEESDTISSDEEMD